MITVVLLAKDGRLELVIRNGSLPKVVLCDRKAFLQRGESNAYKEVDWAEATLPAKKDLRWKK